MKVALTSSKFIFLTLIFIWPAFFASAQDKKPQAQTPAATPNPTPTPITATQLQILRKPLEAMSSFMYSGKDMRINGGPLKVVIRMNGKSLNASSLGGKELSNFEETLVLESANKSRCFVPLAVANDMGFTSVEEFRMYLVETDIAIVECIVDINQSLNIAKAVSFYYNFVRQEKAPEVTLEVKPEPKKPVKAKPSQDGRASQ
jgi:hypothetical protein